MKTKKEKPKYNAFQNSIYMIKLAWKHEKAILFHLLLFVATFIALQLIDLYLAPSVISAVENKVSLSSLVLTIAAFVGSSLVLEAINAYFYGFHQYPRITLRLTMSGMRNGKACDTSYVNRLKKSFSDMMHKVSWAIGGNSSAAEAIWGTLNELLQQFFGLAAMYAILLMIDYRLMLIIIVTALISFSVDKWVYGYEDRHRDEFSSLNQKLGHIGWIERNHYIAKDVRIFGLAGWLEELYYKAFAAVFALRRKQNLVLFLSDLTSLVLTFLRNGIAYAFLINLVFNDGLSASMFLLYFNAVGKSASWARNILSSFNQLSMHSRNLSVYREFLEFDEPFQFEDGKPLPVGKEHTITLENVSFAYPESEHTVLKDINLTLRTGDKIAVVGLNGAGKTTLIKIICGLLDPTSGRVLIDGVDVREYNRRDYYKFFSAVFQNFTVLPQTVAENVAQSLDGIDMTRVKDCIKKAGLTKKIESLPDGYDTYLNREIYENAAEFSGGETQRLMLARALYKDAPFLLLDEPTAALDPIAESEVYEKYNSMTESKGSIFISHRLASTRFCDVVLLLENNVIHERGTHDELMANKGRYYELFSVQSRYYSEGSVTDEAEEN